MELREAPGSNFSDLIGKPVVDASGRRLGRVIEVRAHWSDDRTIVLDELLIGRAALLARLHGPTSASGVPWDSIAELGEERIVVRGPRG